MNEQQIEAWIARDPDPATQSELRALLDAGDHDGLVERFLGRLEFGTAGLRGLLGAGPTRMNRVVVIESSLGVADHILAAIPDAPSRGVVVGFDGRHMSEEFAKDAAAAFAHRGLKVHFFDRVMPTPVCAFAVKHLAAAAGVVVTASHNPPTYNGYKVYGPHGAQIVSPTDRKIAEAIDEVAKAALPALDFDGVAAEGTIRILGNDVIEDYLSGMHALSLHPGTGDRDFPIAYTPLHGVGAELAEMALARSGFHDVSTVASQRLPDGDFPTVAFPNPEEPGAMDAVLALAKERGALLAFANDPDADRLAVAVQDKDGYRMLTGDEIGVLLGNDILEDAKPNDVVATTIVSSNLLARIAEARGAESFETLTGFKWIAQGSLERQAEGKRFRFGYEEALGYTIGDHVRCKDGISALVAFAELAATAKARGESVLDVLYRIYEEFGVVVTLQKSLSLPPGPPVGKKLRGKLEFSVAGRAVACIDDLQGQLRKFPDGSTEPLALPQSDVLIYRLVDDSRIVVRPSGTEPKLKCYYLVRRSCGELSARDAERAALSDLATLMDDHQTQLARVF